VKNLYFLLIFTFQLFLYTDACSQYSILWQRCVGGSDADELLSSVQSFDGGIVLAGETNSMDFDVTGNHGLYDVLVVKLDSLGNLVWQKCYGGTNHDGAWSIIQSLDSGYIITGYSNSIDGDVTGMHGVGDLWMIEIDGNGNLLRQKCFGGSELDGGSFVQITSDHGFIVIGDTQSQDGDVTINTIPGVFHLWLLKLDSAWNIQWQSGFWIHTPAFDNGNFRVEELPTGEYIVGYGGYSNYGFAKFDSMGNLITQRNYGGSDWDAFYEFEKTIDSNFIFVGYARSTDGDVYANHSVANDIWIIKLDSSGNFRKQKCLGGTADDAGYLIDKSSGTNYFVVGTTQSNDGDLSGLTGYGGSDYWLMEIDSNFNIQWQQRFGGGGNDIPTSMFKTANGDYYISGFTYSNNGNVSGNHGLDDFWIMKLRPTTSSISSMKTEPISIAPNPFTDFISISVPNGEANAQVTLTKPTGEVLFNQRHNLMELIDFSYLPQGLYYLTYRSHNANFTKRIIKLE
jgi:hypothetical protein